MSETRKGKTMKKPTQIEITLGESFEGFVKKYPTIKTKKQDTGKWGYLKWYTFNWSTKNPANLVFKNNGNQININDAIYLSILEDSDYVKDGIIELKIQAGITADDWISHDEARLKFHEILQGFLDKGWRRAASLGRPRISRKDAMRYKKDEKDYFYLDPFYLPTLDEWKSLDRGGLMSSNLWVLRYKNKAFMTINVGITDHKTDPNKGAYLLFIEIVNDENEAKKYFSPDTDDRMNKRDWKGLWEERLEEFKATRQKEEIKAIQKGYRIDIHYLDYFIPPGKEKTQAELESEIKAMTFKTGDQSPKSGYYEATLPEGHIKHELLKLNPMHYVVYKKGDVFRPFGFDEHVEKQLRWVWVVGVE